MTYTHPTIVTIDLSNPSHRAHSLRVQCLPVTEFGEELRLLCGRLEAALRASSIAVGIAAPQIGVSQMVAAINIDRSNETLFVVNPEVLETSGKKDIKFESCLSIPYLRGLVERREKARVRFQDIEGRVQEKSLRGFEARVFLHEIDHLHGVLYSDHVAAGSSNLQRADFFSSDADFVKS